MMNINAVKGVEIGAGFASVEQRGSVHSDEMYPDGFASNHAGGILGGISTGQDIEVSIALKPTSSIPQERQSIDKQGNGVMMQTTGRHDPCVGIRATPIAEAMLALVLIDHALRHRAQCGDVMVDTPRLGPPSGLMDKQTESESGDTDEICQTFGCLGAGGVDAGLTALVQAAMLPTEACCLLARTRNSVMPLPLSWRAKTCASGCSIWVLIRNRPASVLPR